MAFKSADERAETIVSTLMDNVFIHHTTILTGSNGSGKSFIRKAIRQAIQRDLEAEGIKDIDPRHLVASVSMERRTSNDGIMNIFNSDTPWVPTSENTFHFINQVLNQDDCYIVIDEPEIGMSEEMQLLLCKEFNEKLAGLKSYGLMIITHSKTIVNNIMHDQFFNLDGLSEEQWLARVPEVPDYTFEEFQEASHKLYQALQERLK